MLITNTRRAPQVAAWAGMACAALLVAACSSPGRPVAASSHPATASAPAAPGVTVSPAGTSTFLAYEQDINGTLLYRPACSGLGCVLSGDSTVILAKMTWSTWSATEAVGTGIDKIDGCNPDCAAGPVYPVPTVVTLSDPVKVCSSSGTRWVWTRASFRFPDGLPKALQGGNGPQNPWVFSSVVSAARRSCAS
jgi:hypothetical protein